MLSYLRWSTYVSFRRPKLDDVVLLFKLHISWLWWSFLPHIYVVIICVRLVSLIFEGNCLLNVTLSLWSIKNNNINGFMPKAWPIMLDWLLNPLANFKASKRREIGPWPRKSCTRDIGLASSASQAVRPYGPRDSHIEKKRRWPPFLAGRRQNSSRTPQLPSRAPPASPVKRSRQVF